MQGRRVAQPQRRAADLGDVPGLGGRHPRRQRARLHRVGLGLEAHDHPGEIGLLVGADRRPGHRAGAASSEQPEHGHGSGQALGQRQHGHATAPQNWANQFRVAITEKSLIP